VPFANLPAANKQCWAQLSDVTYSTYDTWTGVNFVLKVNDQAPLCVSDDRPLIVMDATDVQDI
jgi:hypothetical protein